MQLAGKVLAIGRGPVNVDAVQPHPETGQETGQETGLMNGQLSADLPFGLLSNFRCSFAASLKFYEHRLPNRCLRQHRSRLVADA
jgi:hypothetical protein